MLGHLGHADVADSTESIALQINATSLAINNAELSISIETKIGNGQKGSQCGLWSVYLLRPSSNCFSLQNVNIRFFLIIFVVVPESH